MRSSNSFSGVRVSYSIFSTPTSAIILFSNSINSFTALCPSINASNMTPSFTCFAPASTMLIASCVPATVKSRSDFSCSSADGFITNSPSTLPTLTPAIGPSNGILEIDTARDEPSIAASSGEQS